MDHATPLLKLECDVETTGNEAETSHADVDEKSNVNGNYGNALVCKICKVKLMSVKTFIGHYRIDHMGVKPYVCGKCNLGFDTVDHLKEHHWVHRKRKRTERPKDSCLNIDKDEAFSKKKIAKTETENDDLFACDICGQCCFSLGAYDSHIRTHINNNSNYCYACECSFDDEFDESQHHALYHSDTKKKFTCSACNRGFATQGCFANHTKFCKPKNTYVCKVCYNQYVSTGEEKFCCNVCEERLAFLTD